MTDLEYERHERIAIKLDSRIPLAEAERQTAAEMGETTDVHPGPVQVGLF